MGFFQIDQGISPMLRWRGPVRVTSFSPHLTPAEKQVREAQTHPEAAELRQRQSWDGALLHLTIESLLSASPAPTLPARH